MIRILRLLLTGSWHLHEYEIYETAEIIAPSPTTGNQIIKGKVIIQKCKVCGDIKINRIMI